VDRESLAMFEKDRDTDGVVMIGEIGGSDETDAGRWIKDHMRKPVVAFIAGARSPLTNTTVQDFVRNTVAPGTPAWPTNSFPGGQGAAQLPSNGNSS